MQKYQRLHQNVLNRLKDSKNSKIIAVLGARQVGKTTLLMDFSLKWDGRVIKYLGDKLEDALLWRGTFKNVKNDLELQIGMALDQIDKPILLIFDEIQKIPESFNNLKILYDSYKDKIKIAISGSSSISLLHRTSESLGGRIEIVTMYPLSFVEIMNNSPKSCWLLNSRLDFKTIKNKALKTGIDFEKFEKYLEKTISFGFFPEAYLQEKIEEVNILHQNYHQTYIEKDVRDIREIGNSLDFDLIWKICQQTNAQQLNYSNISEETGLAFNTVKKYVSILSASFNIFLLLPFTKGIRRRLVKSPKIFSIDTGFFNYCLNIYGLNEIVSTQLIGRVFESIMVSEFLKQEKYFLKNGEPFFFRTSTGAEVDLVVEAGLELFAYEFKFSKKVFESDFSGIKSLVASIKKPLTAGFVVSRQPHVERFGDNLYAIPWWYLCT